MPLLLRIITAAAKADVSLTLRRCVNIDVSIEHVHVVLTFAAKANVLASQGHLHGALDHW